MDWQALLLSIKLSLVTTILLIPLAIITARVLAFRNFAGKHWLEALLMTPLILPPTVIGYYLLVGLGQQSWLGQTLQSLTGQPLVFHFSGLVLASLLINIPFALQPIQRAFESIPEDVRDASACCGLTFWESLLKVELPLVWPGIVTAIVLCFSHVLGEFGVVLMIGGNIEGETKTLSIAIYDSVQAFDFQSAGRMSFVLLIFAVSTLAISSHFARKMGVQHDRR
ncbi:molybdate ABC transporter permease subunit [Parashewanella spongiae]|uniref:Molybdenum transport system permease n=1 Tax=Parashewanella spongiae TaxID=342950 RepID=A0A3A6TYQ5_9GAMM|nr:molybdate ABC transporter permease subunit [Parashewanella spongiae]MCL1078068.1 molybdate ABC transporter permease subunit [Parashewanella spongiae]RJY16942.1 molybdate ABC transporter permease subunit [Parashewanella spongiae]